MIGIQRVTETRLDKIQPKRVDQALSLADQRFGKGFFKLEDFEKYLDHSRYISHIATVNDDVIGFSLVQKCDYDEFAELLNIDKKWVRKNFWNFGPYGILKATAVREEFEAMGIGTKLTRASMIELEKVTRSIIGTAWKDIYGNLHVGNMLSNFGLKPILEIPEYWKEDSIKKGYSCDVCGNPPCHCTAVLFAKYY